MEHGTPKQRPATTATAATGIWQGGEVYIQTLVQPLVYVAGQPTEWPAKSAAELLWYLHAHPAGVYRPQFYADVWDTEETPAVQGRFRVALHRLRSVLGGAEAVEEQAGRLNLHPALYLASDVGQLERAMAANTLNIEALAEAIPPQSGLYLPHIQADWVRAERERVTQLQLAALLRLSKLQCACRSCAASLATLKRAAELDPLMGEDERQRLMVCYTVQDGKYKATEDYRRYVRYLRQEVGDTPMPETVALAEKIKRGEVTCDWRERMPNLADWQSDDN